MLAQTGSFEALRERLGPAARPPDARYGRHAGLLAVPHGAKTYLAAALVLAAGERVVWIARDAEVGDRVAEELQAWLGDPGAVAVLEPRTALAYERSELVADETAARVAALAAWRTGQARVLVASSTEFPVGLVVDEVYGFRRFMQRERVGEFAQPVIRADRYLQGAFRRGLEVWPVFSMDQLLQSREFQRAAEG